MKIDSPGAVLQCRHTQDAFWMKNVLIINNQSTIIIIHTILTVVYLPWKCFYFDLVPDKSFAFAWFVSNRNSHEITKINQRNDMLHGVMHMRPLWWGGKWLHYVHIQYKFPSFKFGAVSDSVWVSQGTTWPLLAGSPCCFRHKARRCSNQTYKTHCIKNGGKKGWNLIRFKILKNVPDDSVSMYVFLDLHWFLIKFN